MPQIFEGHLNSKGLRVAIIVSRFNDVITTKLMEGAIDALLRTGADDEDIHVFRVPGAFEIPVVAKKLALQNKWDAIICLGALIKGETSHFDLISAEASKGIAQVSLETGVPMTFGIVTADTVEQAINRAGLKNGNKGFDSALAAIELANLMKNF